MLRETQRQAELTAMKKKKKTEICRSNVRIAPEEALCGFEQEAQSFSAFITTGAQTKTTSEKLENAALFLRLGLPSTLIRHETECMFRRPSPNRKNLKTPAFRFRVDGKHFENGAFRKRWRHD